MSLVICQTIQGDADNFLSLTHNEHVHLGFPYAADHFHIVLLQITTINTPDKLFLKPDNCLELGIFEKEIPC